jgi:hypothetical protein
MVHLHSGKHNESRAQFKQWLNISVINMYNILAVSGLTGYFCVFTICVNYKTPPLWTLDTEAIMAKDSQLILLLCHTPGVGKRKAIGR